MNLDLLTEIRYNKEVQIMQVHIREGSALFNTYQPQRSWYPARVPKHFNSVIIKIIPLYKKFVKLEI